MNEKLLSIYLNDHFAGSVAGVELARRAAGQNEGNRYGPVLDDVAREIEEDREQLKLVMERLGVREDRGKQALAWVGERLGRLKLNGRLTGYSPLSRVVELEGLTMGVSAKLELWESLRRVGDGDLAGIDFKRLIRRAEDQRKKLESLHREAVAEAFLSADVEEA